MSTGGTKLAGAACPVLAAGAVAAMLGLLPGCQGGRSEIDRIRIPGGDPERGVLVIESVGCGTCHTIPGIDEAEGLVGPPLMSWARRSFIAGAVPNQPSNLIRWITNAHSIEPGTAMPDLDVSEQQARDAAAYLYTLE